MAPDPADEVADALSHHLCRCTGYESIVEAVRIARAKPSRARGGGKV